VKRNPNLEFRTRRSTSEGDHLLAEFTPGNALCHGVKVILGSVPGQIDRVRLHPNRLVEFIFGVRNFRTSASSVEYMPETVARVLKLTMEGVIK
jgi:hypothetical protein